MACTLILITGSSSGTPQKIAGISVGSFQGLIQRISTSVAQSKIQFNKQQLPDWRLRSHRDRGLGSKSSSRNTAALFQMLIYSSHTSKLRQRLALKQTVWLKLSTEPTAPASHPMCVTLAGCSRSVTHGDLKHRSWLKWQQQGFGSLQGWLRGN